MSKEVETEESEQNNVTPRINPSFNNIPLAALYDGSHYLIEKYSIGYVQGLLLTDLSSVDFSNANLLIAGASTFSSRNRAVTQWGSLLWQSLPGVELEVSSIASLWPSKILLNEDFTLDNFKSTLEENSFQILHIATHSHSDSQSSLLAFYDKTINLAEIEKINWGHPPPEFVILSSVESVQMNDQGFGFAVPLMKKGVKSILGSLAIVQDDATAKLMVEFHRQLKIAPTKVEALRQAQIKMLNDPETSHPNNWALFVIVGNPW